MLSESIILESAVSDLAKRLPTLQKHDDNVIDDLSPVNLKKLKEIIIRELEGKEISIEDEEIIVTNENIDE